MKAPLAISLALAVLATAPAAAPAEPDRGGVPVPPRTRDRDGDGTLESGRGFRQTVEFYTKWLRRQGVEVKPAPTYRVGDTTVRRFLPAGRTGRWDAIHVWQRGGRTYIYVVLPRA